MVRLLLADDQGSVRSALKLLLEQNGRFHVAGEAANGRELLERTAALMPDLVLVDWELPGLPAADLLPLLRAACPTLTIIALSGRPEARQAALCAGVNAFVSKGDPPEQLLASLACQGRQDLDTKTTNAPTNTTSLVT